MAEYFQIPAGGDFPDVAKYKPYRAIVIIEDSVTNEWQWETSKWLVDSGCKYMMAWGHECSQWDDSVDWADLEKHDFGDIPDEEFVFTSWHENETLEEVFEFAKDWDNYTDVPIANTLLLHISPVDKRSEYLAQYEAA